MTGFDLLILAIYWICVVYVLYQAANSLDDQFGVTVKEAELKEQLQAHELQDQVNIQFKFEKRYKFEDLKDLSISIANKSDRTTIYLDWDHCSFTDFTRRSRRILRIPPPGVAGDLRGAQGKSIAAPSQSLQERLAPEDSLKQTDTGVSITGPLFSIAQLQKGNPKDKKIDAEYKKLYAEFMEKQAPLPFSLRVALQVARESSSRRIYILCQFEARKLPWTDSLPWNQKKK